MSTETDDTIDYDKLRPMRTMDLGPSQGEFDALTHEVGQLRTRLATLATNAELAGFHGLNLAALLTQSLVHVSAADHDPTLTEAGRNHAAKLAKRIRAALGVE